MFKPNPNLSMLPVAPMPSDGIVRVVIDVADPKARKEAIQRHADRAGVSTARIRLV